jgi:hypothetical protein
MPGMPGMPEMPGMPGMGEMPGMPGMPEMPGMPGMPVICIPLLSLFRSENECMHFFSRFNGEF